jgi:pimeloyl-ACP methyl ester carboxylesterase
MLIAASRNISGIIRTVLCRAGLLFVFLAVVLSASNSAYAEPGKLLAIEPSKMPTFFRAKAWRITYETTDFAGRPLISTGLVVASTVPKKRRSIVAFAHPTVGTTASCAPSLRQSPTQYILGLRELIAAGHIIVATDYPGLGTPGPIGYLVGKGQARAVLDSVRAVAQIKGLTFTSGYAVYGYSQGGHAALFAASEAPTYMPEYSLRGVVAIAPPTDLAKLFAADIGSVEGNILMSFTLHSWQLKYGLDLKSILSAKALRLIRYINTLCIDNMSGKIDAFSAQGQFDGSTFLRNPLKHPQLRQALISNSLSILPAHVPLMVVQGGSDSIVIPSVTSAAVAATCRMGGQVTFLQLPNNSHAGTAIAAFPSVTNWIGAILAGRLVKSSCR